MRCGNDKIVSDLKVMDTIMNDSFWIGVYSGLTGDTLDDMTQSLRNAVEGAATGV